MLILTSFYSLLTVDNFFSFFLFLNFLSFSYVIICCLFYQVSDKTSYVQLSRSSKTSDGFVTPSTTTISHWLYTPFGNIFQLHLVNKGSGSTNFVPHVAYSTNLSDQDMMPDSFNTHAPSLLVYKKVDLTAYTPKRVQQLKREFNINNSVTEGTNLYRKNRNAQHFIDNTKLTNNFSQVYSKNSFISYIIFKLKGLNGFEEYLLSTDNIVTSYEVDNHNASFTNFPTAFKTAVDSLSKNGLYVICSAYGEILYVGMTTTGSERIQLYYKDTVQNVTKETILVSKLLGRQNVFIVYISLNDFIESEVKWLESQAIYQLQPSINVTGVVHDPTKGGLVKKIAANRSVYLLFKGYCVAWVPSLDYLAQVLKLNYQQVISDVSIYGSLQNYTVKRRLHGVPISYYLKSWSSKLKLKRKPKHEL